jgi:hypothetical protein
LAPLIFFSKENTFCREHIHIEHVLREHNFIPAPSSCWSIPPDLVVKV